MEFYDHNDLNVTFTVNNYGVTFNTASGAQVYEFWGWRPEGPDNPPPGAGVREPRRPVPAAPAGALALEHAGPESVPVP